MHLFVSVTCVVPPSYDPNYPPQQPGGYPPQGYPPQQPGYAPPAPAQQAISTNIVVVGGAPAQQTTIIQQPKEKVNHILHLLIMLFLFPPWVFVWMILCCIYGC